MADKRKLGVPTKLRVMGKMYEVKLVPAADVGEDYGDCNDRVGQIRVACDAYFDEQRDTVMHEALHALDHALNTKLKERQVRVLATGIVLLLLDNPQLASYLTHGRKQT